MNTPTPSQKPEEDAVLAACPFCGGIGEMSHYSRGNDPKIAGHLIECSTCGSSGESIDIEGEMPDRVEYTKAEAIAAWNRRTPSPAHEEMRKALEEAHRVFEQIRLILIHNLDEPERSAFWIAVSAKDRLSRLLASSPQPAPDSASPDKRTETVWAEEGGVTFTREFIGDTASVKLTTAWTGGSMSATIADYRWRRLASLPAEPVAYRNIGKDGAMNLVSPPVAEAGDAGGEAVAIKPLVWKEEPLGYFVAETAFGEYRIEDMGPNWTTDRFHAHGPGEIEGDFSRGRFASKEAAERYLWAQHKADIRSCLTTPSPLPEAEKPGLDAETVAEALRPFALVAQYDIGDDEADTDLFKPMSKHNRAPRLVVGELRRALEVYRALSSTGAAPETASRVDGGTER